MLYNLLQGALEYLIWIGLLQQSESQIKKYIFFIFLVNNFILVYNN